MYAWSDKSIRILQTCDPQIGSLFTKVLEYHDASPVYGWRGESTQNQLYADGLSKKQWPESKHNNITLSGQPHSLAIDIVPYIKGLGAIMGNRPGDLKYFYRFNGVVMVCARNLGLSIRWGGDWDGDMNMDDQTFNDLYHYELGD